MDQDRIKIAEFCGITFTEIKNGIYIGYRNDPSKLETIPDYTGSRDDFWPLLDKLSGNDKNKFINNLGDSLRFDDDYYVRNGDIRIYSFNPYCIFSFLACPLRILVKAFIDTIGSQIKS